MKLNLKEIVLKLSCRIAYCRVLLLAETLVYVIVLEGES